MCNHRQGEGELLPPPHPCRAGWIAVCVRPSLLCNSTVLPTPPEPPHTIPGETEEKCRMTTLKVKGGREGQTGYSQWSVQSNILR